MAATGPKFDLVFDDSAITALLDRVDRGSQNAFKRGLRAALKVFREGAAAYVGARGYPNRWRNPNRGYRTSVDTRLTYMGAGGRNTGKGWEVNPNNKNRQATGFRIAGKLFSSFPGAFIEYGFRQHWMRVTPALVRWARRHKIKQLTERTGIWIRGKKPKTDSPAKPPKAGKWVTRKSGKRVFYSYRWLATFARNPRLEAWAKRHGLTTKTAVLVRKQPPRPFVKPGSSQHSEDARTAFKDVILSWMESTKNG